ncbi:HEPN domain-containing protein [Aeromonas veronii]|uniref:HEPN domain-containing protein n=1 Tax=Aeromonas TaxID=642 RepID=UPI002441A206|nr:HEPN domain-containing protein [Aeromonas veronii]
MNIQEDPIYAGVSGVPKDVGEIDFGSGVILRPTFAHLMAPFLLAFAPAPPNSHHPGPWAAVNGGLGLDIHAELYIPDSFSPPNFFDRLNTVWWITSLLRLALSPQIHVPVISNEPFHEISKDSKNARILPVEAFTHRYHGSLYEPKNVDESISWVVRTWKEGQGLMRDSRFNDTYQALDSIWCVPSPSLALVTLWGALENLFSPSKQELRFRVSANIASYLEAPGNGRLDLQKRLLKLYDSRSGAAHGANKDVTEALAETKDITRRVLYKIFETRNIPTKEDLERELFGVTNN